MMPRLVLRHRVAIRHQVKPINRLPNRKIGVPVVLLAGVCWSLSGLIYRLVEEASEWQVLFFRSISLFVTLLLYLLIRYQHLFLAAVIRAGLPALAGGICLSIAFTTYILALDNTSVANAGFALATAPFFTAILARIILGEQIVWGTALSMGFAAIGLIIMTAGELQASGGLGNLYALTSALGFAGMTISLRSRPGIDMLPTILHASLLASVFSALVILFTNQSFSLIPIDLGYSVSLGVFQIGLGFLLFTQGAKHLPAAELSLLSLTEIIVGPLLVWLVIHEIPNTSTLIGGAIIISAIMVVAIVQISKPRI